jgi:hypothetical protein
MHVVQELKHIRSEEWRCISKRRREILGVHAETEKNIIKLKRCE